ncbi:MAG TPA: hypothetical protein VFP39_17250 [Gemmatimonadales bacterium]|nr:hypothetical protein [Gemmatimonadales bacterium]
MVGALREQAFGEINSFLQLCHATLQVFHDLGLWGGFPAGGSDVHSDDRVGPAAFAS